MATPLTSLESKDEFVNTTDGWLGAVQLDHQGKALGVSVEPGGSVFLTEQEQVLTANAPRSDEDNPFANGALKLTRRAIEVRNRRPYGGQLEEPEESETGAPPADVDPEAPEGTNAAGEEVATPQARRRRR